MDTPRQVAEKLVTGISEGRFEEVPRLYAEDCVVEVPYATGGAAPLLEGGAAVREHFSHADAMPFRLRARDLVVHETEDPELVVLSWDYEVTATTIDEGWDIELRVSREWEGPGFDPASIEARRMKVVERGRQQIQG